MSISLVLGADGCYARNPPPSVEPGLKFKERLNEVEETRTYQM